MKLSTISNTLNVRNTIEYLTKAILSGDPWVILDTEFGDIPVEISDLKTHDVEDPNFGIFVSRFREAPFTMFVSNLIRNDGTDKYRWYVNIPFVNGQSEDFTRELVIRSMMMVLMGEIVEDTAYRLEDINPNTVDAACAIYKFNYLKDECHNYQQFNRELCKLSVTPIQRVGQNYRSFLLSNREFLRIRCQLANSRECSCKSDFRLHHDEHHDITFGGSFYDTIFALVVEDLHIYLSTTTILDAYKHATGPKTSTVDECLPVPLMKICLLNKALDKKKGDK